MGNRENMIFGVFLALLSIFGISHGGDVTCTKDNYIMKSSNDLPETTKKLELFSAAFNCLKVVQHVLFFVADSFFLN